MPDDPLPFALSPEGVARAVVVAASQRQLTKAEVDVKLLEGLLTIIDTLREELKVVKP